MTVSGGAPVLASDINEALNRRIGKTQAVSDYGSTIAGTEVVTETVTVNVKANRTYLVKGYYPISGSTTTDDFFVLIRQGFAPSDAQLTYDRVHFDVAGGVYVGKPEVEFTATADGIVTFGISCRRVSGSSTVATPRGATSQPRFITVTMVTTE